MYLLPDMKNKRVIPLGATRPDSKSYGKILLQLQEMLREEDCAKWFDYGNVGEMHWHRRAGALLLERGLLLLRDILVNIKK